MPNTKTIDSPLAAADIENFEQALRAKRQEVVNLYQHDVKVGQESTDDNSDDFADRANNSYNRETMFALSDVERKLVFQIDEALERVEKATFGDCTHCGNKIGMARLEALPWARHCIDCQEKEERGLLHD